MSWESTSWVAPFTGAWIEIIEARVIAWLAGVAPFTGAWIEMFYAASALCPV